MTGISDEAVRAALKTWFDRDQEFSPGHEVRMRETIQAALDVDQPPPTRRKQGELRFTPWAKSSYPQLSPGGAVIPPALGADQLPPHVAGTSVADCPGCRAADEAGS